MAKDIREKPIDNVGADRTWRDLTTEACFCGCRSFYIVATFHDGDISGWFTEAMCFECNTWYRVPAPTVSAGDLAEIL